MEESDAELVRRGVRNDPQALHALVDRHAEALFAIANSMLRRASDAEDVVQDTFMACFMGLKRFEGRSSVRTWLVSILLRQISAKRRRDQRRPMLSWSDTPAQAAKNEPPPDAKLDLAEAMATLSDEHREVLLLREYGGLSYEEIATTLGLPRGTVESRLHRARHELAQRLSGYTEP